jgi:hypothetical protein
MAGKVTTKTKACQQQKIAVVMSEFKKKKLNSNAGTRVVNPKQAIAIALSVANRYCTPGRPFLKKRASPKNTPFFKTRSSKTNGRVQRTLRASPKKTRIHKKRSTKKVSNTPFLKKRASPKNKKKRSVKKVSKKRSPKKVSKKRSAAKKTSKKRSVKRSTKKV